MAIRHYVLLATDGFIGLPTTSDLCPSPSTLQQLYVFGFVGGLFRVIENGCLRYENKELDWTDPANRKYLKGLTSTASIPSPMIWAEVGDQLYITLINLGMPVSGITDPHTVHLHGAHVATQIDGFPETSFDVPMWMNEPEPPTTTYYFLTEGPGTLMYHCHVQAHEHIQMGMYGALVIYPSKKSLEQAGIVRNSEGWWELNGVEQRQIPRYASNRNFAYNDINTFFNKEYVMLLSDIDLKWHQTVQAGLEFNASNFKPDFWLVNGRAFPDTLLPHPQTPRNDESKYLKQINYESYVHVRTDQKFLLRMINMGYQVAPWHIHGWHFSVIGKDAHISPFLLIDAEMAMHSMPVTEMGFTATIGSGETFDLLLTADNKAPVYGKYIFRGQNGIPSLCSQMAELAAIDPTVIAQIPTEPVICSDINTVNYIELCETGEFFPQFYPMHNHDDYKVTNTNTLVNPAISVYPGGQLTFIQTDAPSGNSDS
jgi:Putative multicopper oxidases